MKLNIQAQTLVAAVLITSFMLACAPAKKSGAGFADRTGSANRGDTLDASKVTGKSDSITESSRNLEAQILKIDIQIKKARNSDGNDELDELIGDVLTGGDQASAEKNTEDSTQENSLLADLAPRDREQRPLRKYLISAKISFADVGEVEFAGLNDQTGRESLRRLTPVREACEVKLANTKVRASCVEEDCAKVVVVIENTERGANTEETRVQKVLKRDGDVTVRGDIDVIKYVALDRQAEMQERGMAPSGAAACAAAEIPAQPTPAAAATTTTETNANTNTDTQAPDDILSEL